MIKVSFILPCYKVAPYVGRCIESIEHQDIPQEEYEIICVDDCSPDNTGDVVRQYQQQYANIVYHRHAVNKTSGGARNTGIDLARGEYIWFVDPDDAVVENCLGMLYARAKELDTDILSFNIQVTTENGEIERSSAIVNTDEVLNGSDYIATYYNRTIGIYQVSTVWRSLYKTSFVKGHNLRYPEIKASQDVVFVWKTVLEAERMSSVSDVCYSYFQRAGSMTGRKGRLKGYAVFSQSLLFAKELKNILEQYTNARKDVTCRIEGEMTNSVNRACRDVLLMNPKERRAFYKIIKENAALVDEFRPYMDRKTKNIYRYEWPFVIWGGMMYVYVWVGKIRGKGNGDNR